VAVGFYELDKWVRAKNFRALDEHLTPELAQLVDEGDTLLHTAVICRDEKPSAEMIEYLISHGVPVDRPAAGSYTALHIAARDHGPTIVRALLSGGAFVDPVDRYGKTPLWWATGEGRIPAVEVLIEFHADPDKKSQSGVSPRDMAAQDPALLAALDGARAPVVEAKPYSPRVRFAVGDRIAHPKFGEGTVGSVLPDGKISVEFREGVKLLLHARS
jgi:ankyrin repeat protein